MTLSYTEPGTSFVQGLNKNLTITQDLGYDYQIAHVDFDHESTFAKTANLAKQLRDLLKGPLSLAQKTAFHDDIMYSLAHMVYGSNYIEKVGAGLDITFELCMKIFKGEPVPEDKDVNMYSNEYQCIKAYLLDAKLPANPVAVLHSYHEITQHAKAAAYMIHAICLQNHQLSEEIILQAHRILTYKVNAESAPWSEYGGVYRSGDVTAGFNSFASVSSIPSKMKTMVKELQCDMNEAKMSGHIDPIMLAAKYSHIFINIHPFLDGNGRMSRLILNTLLLKLGGFIVCLGENAAARDNYLEVSSSATQLESTYEGREEEEKPVMHKEWASLVLSYAPDSLDDVILELIISQLDSVFAI